MKNYSRYEHDKRKRSSFFYRLKRWFWSNHMEEVQTIIILVGGAIFCLLWFGSIFFLPSIFR